MIYKNSLWLYFVLNLGIALFIILFDLSFDFVGITFLLIYIQSISFLCYLDKGYASLAKIYFSFICIFFSITPWLHYSNSIIFWGGRGFTIYDYIFTNCTIFLSNMFFVICYITSKSRQNILTNKKNTPNYFSLIEKIFLGVISYTALFILLLYNNFNFPQLFFWGAKFINYKYITNSSEIFLIVGNSIRLIPLFCFFYAYISRKKLNLSNSLLLFSMIVCIFPTGVSRYLTAAVYISFFLLLFPVFRNGLIFTLAIFSSIIFAFPFFNQFREFYSLDNITIIPKIDFFLAEHFDAYQSLARVMQIDFVSYGYQLLGVILFFIPRSIWNQKPFGSGHEMANQLDYIFSNISMPYLAEGYVNYGIVGLIIFSTLIGFSFGSLDKKYSFQMLSGEISYSGTVYLYLFGALFFLLRGDLMSTFAYLTAGLLSACFVYLLMKLLRIVSLRK